MKKFLLWFIIFVFCRCGKDDNDVIREGGGEHGFYVAILNKDGDDLLNATSSNRVKSVTLRYDDNLPVCYIITNLGIDENVSFWMYWINSEYTYFNYKPGFTVYSLEDRIHSYVNNFYPIKIYPYNKYNVLFTPTNGSVDKNGEAVYTFKTETSEGIISTDSIRIQYFSYESESGKTYRLAENVYLNDELRWNFYSDGAFAGDCNLTIEAGLKETPYVVLVK